MGVLLFSFYPQMAAFLPLFYLPISSMILLILSFAPVSGGPCHFKENNLSPYSGKPVGVSTKTQYYFSYQNYGRKDPNMFLYWAFGRWPCPKKLENRDSGVKIQRRWLSCISTSRFSYSIIPNSSCVSGSMRNASHRCVWHIDPSPSSPFSVSSLQNFESELLWCWLITELL